MSSKKVTTQKVIAILKKADLATERQMNRSGYSVTGIYDNYEFIEVGYTHLRHFEGSTTANMVERLTKAAEVLTSAGLTVLMQLPKDSFDYIGRKLYIPKDPELGISRLSNKSAFDAKVFAKHYAKEIERELAHEAEEKIRKEAETTRRANKQAEALARATELNPEILLISQAPDLFTAKVTLMDGREAVLFIAVTTKEEYDWQATVINKAYCYYTAFELDLTAIYRSTYASQKWERTGSTLLTGKGESVIDGIRYWISQRS